MDLIKEKCIDHYILYEEVNIKQKKIHLYSINIAQLSHIRTMTMYNKLNCFLKNYEIPIDNKKVQEIFNEIPNIILKYNLHKKDIEEGIKEEVKDKRVLKELLKLTEYPFEKVYKRKYIPKGRFLTDNIFKKRFEQTNYIYLDIIFKEESIKVYKKRVYKTCQYLVSCSKKQKNVLFCFQEIYPIINFVEVIVKFPKLTIIDPKIKDFYNTKEEDLYKTLFFKSNNVLISKDFPFHVERIKTEYDIFLNFFNCRKWNGSNWITERNMNQNIKYYIPDLDLYIYNIHSFLYRDKKIKTIFEESFIPFLKKNKKKFIFVGDFNFQMKEETIEYIKELLKKENIISRFVINPFSLKKKNYDGIIIKL